MAGASRRGGGAPKKTGQVEGTSRLRFGLADFFCKRSVGKCFRIYRSCVLQGSVLYTV